jgi:hypothetical protein
MAFSHFKAYVQETLPQINADPSTGVVPIGKLTFTGDETGFKHSGYGGFQCLCV